MARADVDRNLLFGLLALQTGLIDQSALSRAFRAWAADKSRTLAEILADQGALPIARKDLLEALVGEHIETHGGDPTRSLATINVGQSTLETLAQVGDPDLGATLSLASPEPTVDASTERTASFDVGSSSAGNQRFRVLRPHAKGGLGAVFVALDSELNREVALKQILDKHADDPASRSRFLLEAEITGGLEHPGIVPVYGLGTFRNGRPYYAMRFIKGDSLKDAIARHHRTDSGADDASSGDGRKSTPKGSPELELRKLLRRFLDVCNAIEYAHQRGVLHRDLKPGNVMVGKYGETLVVDWGLAKPVGKPDGEPSEGEVTITPSHSSGTVETIPGSAIGTPAYMSPEQAAGQLERLGTRSDVYSLGATLYCLLTGRPPYEGIDAGAVLMAAQRGELAPPRKHKPSIDRALEAVCLKAMAFQPEDRYPTPRALADEVERWMADEPVQAYPEPRGRRLARWARRHASLVTGGVVFLGLAALGLGLIAWLVTRQNHRLELARLEIERQSERAKKGSEMARMAVKSMLFEVARDKLLSVPHSEKLRVGLAERALEFYREFIQLNPDDPEFIREHARFEEQVASLYRMTGQFDLARVEYDRSIEILKRLIARHPEVPKARDNLAYTESQLAESIRMAGGSDAEVEPHYREAVRIARQLRLEFPKEPRYTSLLARTENDLANMLMNAGRSDEAEPLAGEAVGAAIAYRESLPEKPDPAKFRFDWLILPMNQSTHGATLARLQRTRDAEVPLRASVDALRGLLEVYPDSNDLQFLLADTLKELGDAIAVDRPRLHEALRDLDEAVDLAAPLPEKFPLVLNYAKYLPILRADRGALRLEAGQLGPARDDLDFAEPKLAGRVRAEANAVEPLRELGKVKASLARLAGRGGLRDRARSLADEACELQQKAVDIDRDNRVDRMLLVRHQALRKELDAP